MRTGEDRRAPSSTLGAARVYGYPFAALCHVLKLSVTACKCSERAVSTAAEAKVKNPSKEVPLQRERRLLIVTYAAKIPFAVAGMLSRLLCRVSAP